MSDFSSRKLHIKPEKLVLISSCIVFLGAFLVLVGWQFDIRVLQSILPQFISMKANTAIGLASLAAANVIFRHDSSDKISSRRTSLGLFFSSLTFLIGILTLAEYQFGIDFKIDELFFTDTGGITGKFPPGRLAPITATIFVLLSTAQYMIFNSIKNFFRAGQLLSVLAMVVAFQALVGYGFGVSYSFGLAYYTQMAIHTTVMTILVCTGLLFSRSKRGWMQIALAETAGGQMARSLLLWAVLVPPFVHWIELTGVRLHIFNDDFTSVVRVTGNMTFFVIMVLRSANQLHSSDLRKKQSEEERVKLAAEIKSAAAVQVSEARLRAIFDAAFDAIVGMNSDGVITDWNPRAEVIFGWTRSDVVGKKMSEMGMGEFLSPGHGLIMNETIEVSSVRRNGERFPVQLSVTSINIDGRTLFTAFISDITTRKKIEQDLIKAREVALDAVDSKSAFLANMSHEIRTPLNGIIGMTDLLLETPLDPLQKRYAKIVQDSGTGLLSIINDILDFSKIDAGKLKLEILEFSPVTLIESQAELLASNASGKGLSVITFVDPTFPETLKGDSGRLGQVLLNLISNAIKFTEKGRIFVNARLIESEGGVALVKFSVEDTGIGLSKEACERLFQPFVQADGSTARKYGGTGLGLSICKQLVELMGGSIQIKSELGKGTQVSFHVPLGTVSLLPEANPSRMTTTLPLDQMRILIVDDDPVAREVLGHYLHSWKMIVIEAANAERGLALMKKSITNGKPFDLVISDNRMPGMDGFTLAKEIKKVHDLAKVPLILVTAYDQKAQKEVALESGFAYYMTKPIKQSVLYDGIVTALQKNTVEVTPSLEMLKPEPVEPLNFRILVAEDNSVNQLLTITQLKKLGYTALAVADGGEVLEAIKNTHYDLILMDCQMPEIDGYEATRRIREIETRNGTKRIPIIALTANAMKEDQVRCKEAGMDDFVSKPTKKDVLGAVLKKWLVMT